MKRTELEIVTYLLAGNIFNFKRFIKLRGEQYVTSERDPSENKKQYF